MGDSFLLGRGVTTSFPGDKRGVIKDGVGRHALQLGVDILQRSLAPDLRHLHPAKFRRSLVDAHVADTVLAAQICDYDASLVLL